MASGWTNRGLYIMLGVFFQADSAPANFYIHMVNSTPDADDNTLSDLTEASNYTAISIARDAVDFDVQTEDDAGNTAYVQIKDTVLTASGGTMTATHAVLVDDNATAANRQIIGFFDLGATQNIPSGSTLTLTDLQLTLSA